MLPERIGVADEMALGSSGEHHSRPRGVDGCACRLQAFHRHGELMEGDGSVARGVLDREARDPGLDAEADALGDAGGMGSPPGVFVSRNQALYRLAPPAT